MLDPHDEFSLAEYIVAAEACCREIVARGRTPLFVGGSGLYLRGVLRGASTEVCKTQWILAVTRAQFGGTGSPLLPSHTGPSPSPLPFG